MVFPVIDSFRSRAVRQILAHWGDYFIAWSTFRRVCCGVVLLTIVPLVAKGAPDSQVNERLPVSNAEREAHWGIDCAALLTTLTTGAFLCPLEEGLLQELKLCRFVYQPPGDGHRLPCPDYRALLERAKQGDCENLQTFTQQLQCQNTPREHQ